MKKLAIVLFSAMIPLLVYASWPSDDLTTTHLDQATDDPSQARSELYNAVVKLKAILGEVTPGSTVWSSSNDGSGSGLDADLLDGQHGSYYLSRANHTGTQALSTIGDAGALAAMDTIDNSTWASGGDDLVVANGGTGASSMTAYGPVIGGTTSTGALQSISPGTFGQVLTSNGSSAAPTFQDLPSTGSYVISGTIPCTPSAGSAPQRPHRFRIPISGTMDRVDLYKNDDVAFLSVAYALYDTNTSSAYASASGWNTGISSYTTDRSFTAGDYFGLECWWSSAGQYYVSFVAYLTY